MSEETRPARGRFQNGALFKNALRMCIRLFSSFFEKMPMVLQ